MRALKHCEWKAKPGMDDCVALEGTLSYFAYSWVAGEHPGSPLPSKVHGIVVRLKPVQGGESSAKCVYEPPQLLPDCRAEGLRSLWLYLEGILAPAEAQ